MARGFPYAADIYASAFARAMRSFAGYIKASEWCAENIYLPAEVASVEGPFKPWPWQTLWLDLMTGEGNPTKLAIIKSSRVGYTQTGISATLYSVVYSRRHISWNQTTLDDAVSFAKDTVRPAVDNCPPALEALEASAVDGRTKQAQTQMRFGGKYLRVSGAGSPAAFRRFTADMVFLDEVSGYKAGVGREGSPLSLAERSIRNSPFRRIIVGSTPAEEESCVISEAWDRSRLKLTFAIPCPRCGKRAALQWEDVEYVSAEKLPDIEERADTAMMRCRSCRQLWGHEELPDATRQGRWEHREGGKYQDAWVDESGRRPVLRTSDGIAMRWPTSVGLYIWSAYSPIAHCWRDLVSAYLNSRVDAELDKAFVNTWLGRAWSPDATELESNDMKARAVKGEAPDWVQCVHVTVDVQAGHDGNSYLSALVVGWGYHDSFAILERREFYGRIDVDKGKAWVDFTAWLKTRPTWRGIPVTAIAIDTGYEPDLVYSAMRHIRLTHHRVEGVRGSPDYKHAIVRRGSRGGGRRGPVYTVGTHKAKNWIVNRIAGKAQDGPWPKVWFSAGLSDEVFAELSAEKRVYDSRKGRHIWKGTGRNEALDCLVYSLAIHRAINPDILDPEAWDAELEARAERGGKRLTMKERGYG